MNLTENQMRKFETENLMKKVRELELREYDYRQTIVNLKFEKATLEKELQTLKCDILRKEKSLVHIEKNKAHKEYVEGIKEEFNITGSWGYDPDSGEVKESEE